ncbi:MAG: hypothetical protein R3F11_28730 [Verrucomicrobiales bacterium]
MIATDDGELWAEHLGDASGEQSAGRLYHVMDVGAPVGQILRPSRARRSRCSLYQRYYVEALQKEGAYGDNIAGRPAGLRHQPAGHPRRSGLPT